MQPHALDLDKLAGGRMGGLKPHNSKGGHRCKHAEHKGEYEETSQN